MNTFRKLPIGIQDFEDLRTNNYLYVDKTAYIYQLATSGKPYFLSRPRRFGKSLFLSTLKAYFLGKKELFDGLAIAELEKEWVEYPVIYIDFNLGMCLDVGTLYETLLYNVKTAGEQLGILIEEKNPSVLFSKLIRSAYERTGRKVVVLVDEYDKPLLNTMDKPDVNDAMRDMLKSFYGVLKGMDACLRFVFLTGVTKFSKVSIFSDLNQLQDISMDDRFAGICGISERELLRDFQPELQALANKRKITRDQAFSGIKKRYDGYHFAKESEDMYNPFSVLSTFSKLDFDYYWFQTGTPTFLVKMVKDVDFDIPKLENDVKIPARSIMDYRVENADPVPVLYQSGYLTIKEYDDWVQEYTLGFPNEEVKYGFFNELLMIYLPVKAAQGEFYCGRFVRDLWDGHIEGFMTRLQAFLSNVPYELNNTGEKHYQTVFFLLFKLMGQFIEVEHRSAKGRA
ncbi:MAG: ATP-binding protein, partial [Prevotellaceae bacterium]|nr:ATP-binding protein [Prevotellaceae bacterium]